ncbi:hypothetical protein GA0074692_4007 [Micromonospora pallida]|uniref:Uncharacterized protein n=1 Tax=Micromonospora pallida TaxID=145854 RepID=A0A1C6T0C7_9ACTN|nr:hypothetical protein GA0074692_4007 [Micromonospora pallida]
MALRSAVGRDVVRGRCRCGAGRRHRPRVRDHRRTDGGPGRGNRTPRGRGGRARWQLSYTTRRAKSTATAHEPRPAARWGEHGGGIGTPRWSRREACGRAPRWGERARSRRPVGTRIGVPGDGGWGRGLRITGPRTASRRRAGRRCGGDRRRGGVPGRQFRGGDRCRGAGRGGWHRQLFSGADRRGVRTPGQEPGRRQGGLVAHPAYDVPTLRHGDRAALRRLIQAGGRPGPLGPTRSRRASRAGRRRVGPVVGRRHGRAGQVIVAGHRRAGLVVGAAHGRVGRRYGRCAVRRVRGGVGRGRRCRVLGTVPRGARHVHRSALRAEGGWRPLPCRGRPGRPGPGAGNHLDRADRATVRQCRAGTVLSGRRIGGSLVPLSGGPRRAGRASRLRRPGDLSRSVDVLEAGGRPDGRDRQSGSGEPGGGLGRRLGRPATVTLRSRTLDRLLVGFRFDRAHTAFRPGNPVQVTPLPGDPVATMLARVVEPGQRGCVGGRDVRRQHAGRGQRTVGVTGAQRYDGGPENGRDTGGRVGKSRPGRRDTRHHRGQGERDHGRDRCHGQQRCDGPGPLLTGVRRPSGVRRCGDRPGHPRQRGFRPQRPSPSGRRRGRRRRRDGCRSQGRC